MNGTEPMKGAYFVTGIDTDAGKTYVTGLLARQLMEQGLSVVTQKFIQTGCTDRSEDIEVHRRLMGIGLLPEDLDHTTDPVIFHYPASAQLAARIDGRQVDLDLIGRSTATLASRFDVVLVEGAGGLMVPITDNYLTIDYVAQHRLPTILVTNGRLGSINHTLLSLEAIARRDIPLYALAYNTHFDSDEIIAADTVGFLRRYIRRNHPDTLFLSF